MILHRQLIKQFLLRTCWGGAALRTDRAPNTPDVYLLWHPDAHRRPADRSTSLTRCTVAKRFLEKVQVGLTLFFSKITFLSHTNTTHTLHLTRLQQVLSTMQIVLKRARRSGGTGYEPMGTFSPVLQSCTSTYHPETYFPKMVLS